jgi:hypothetical protein
VYLTNLFTALAARYETTGEIAVLKQAVDVSRAAVAATPSDHAGRSGYLSNLANGLRLVFERTGDEQALAEAEQASRDAVAGAAREGQVTYLGNLGTVLHTRFAHTGDVAALAEAVQVTRSALAATGQGSADRSLCLSNLAEGLRQLAGQTDDRELLAEAARVAADAVAETHADRPAYAGYLMNLGYVLIDTASETGDLAALVRARECFAEAARSTVGPVAHRIRGYREAAALTAATGGEQQQELDELEAAVALLPLVVPRTLVRADQQHAVSNLASLASQVAAAAVSAGRLGRAVELLEQTRGILVADTLDSRSSDLGRLRTAAPALAGEFEKLRSSIDALDRADGLDGSPELRGQRRDAYAAWGDLIAQIRTVSGFAEFLRPPDIAVLAKQASVGPIIFPYASGVRCGALILTGDTRSPVSSVTFDVTEEDVAAQRAKLARALERDDQGALRELLAWLWDAIAGPVLTAAGYRAIPAGRPPRVWWCPIGIFAHLPLHAAGYHDGSPRTVLDLVVSSYATTIRGMAYARASQPPASPRGTLIVSASNVPGVSPLRGASREARILSRFIPAAMVLRHPTRQTVMASLPSSWVAHFACHGYADTGNPAASQLVLYDHHTNPLTVSDVGSLRLVSGLAYLSACESAVTSFALADEAVHLAGAFFLAGYQNVIGTLWPVNDYTAGLIAEDFYRRLTSDGTRPPDTAQTSYALHDATRQLRDKFPDQPAHWAGYLHTGS